ncbi:hypothetical protein M8818_007425 [Zalaria obscura]|uniref:Uncharacterized protein n=1 Tax=Zalaria obscura TaxID=2024903 RepID=A0ACC3S3Y1_9PEZI
MIWSEARHYIHSEEVNTGMTPACFVNIEGTCIPQGFDSACMLQGVLTSLERVTEGAGDIETATGHCRVQQRASVNKVCYYCHIGNDVAPTSNVEEAAKDPRAAGGRRKAWRLAGKSCS